MAISNEKIQGHEWLAGMYAGEYFPDFLVDKIKAILLDLCGEIEREQPEDHPSLLRLTHAATERINDLAEEFDENESELETVRRETFAAATDELELGLSAVAAPVYDETGRVIAALSVSGPTLRLTPRRIAELRPIVIKQARALSEQLGHRPEGVHAA